jgi:hypothetical protein
MEGRAHSARYQPLAAVAESIMSSRFLSLSPHRPEVTQINVKAVSILGRECIVVDNILDVGDGCVQLSAVEFAFGQGSIELRQVPLGIIDPLEVFASRAGHSGCPSQVFLDPAHQSAHVAVAARLSISRRKMC